MHHDLKYKFNYKRQQVKFTGEYIADVKMCAEFHNSSLIDVIYIIVVILAIFV